MKDLRAGLEVTPMLHLLRQLGEGGMGKVWIARHKGLDTDVVVKFLSDAGTAADREDAEARFAREAAAAAAVKSPHVVQVFDHGITADGRRYIVMELLEGRDLATHLATHGPMSPVDLSAVVSQVAKALSKAHQAGVIHRDVKPENIFLCDGEAGEMFVKVLDFGIAKRELAGMSKTTTGAVIGTPYYMSPEQLLGEHPVDPRSDIWSLGVVAFEALTGRRPFEGATVGAVTLAIHAAERVPSAVLPSLPPAIDDWFRRACARNPDKRFQTVREAAHALIAASGDTAPPSSPALFRPAMVSVADGDYVASPSPGLVGRTTTSSTFSGPASRRRKPPALLLGGAVVALAVLGVLVVLGVTASHKGEVRGANASSSTASVVPSVAPSTSAGAGLNVNGADTADPASVGFSASTAASANASASTTATIAASAVPAAPRPRAPRGPATATSAKVAHPVRRPNDDDIK